MSTLNHFNRVSDIEEFIPGSYGKDSQGTWMICFPDGRLGNLKLHTVTEHEDGTISVTPSILVTGGGSAIAIHGYLERGIWRNC